MKKFLKPTEAIESAHPSIVELAGRLAGGDRPAGMKAKSFFYFVRENVRYDALAASFTLEHYRAGRILDQGRGYCVQKAVVLAALARAAGIPARLAFADIRNRLASENLVRLLGTDLFVYHGYAELWIEGRWVKATPTFEKDICAQYGFPVVEFDGSSDAVFPPVNAEGKPFVEYVRHHGSFADVPLPRILAAWEEAYGKDRIEVWKKSHGL
jgi:transglutaminase-like putative cysteine protease